MALAQSLEGLARNVGMHAGGVLIAPGKLTDFTPLYSAEGASAMVSQFDKDDVEKAGLVKFDFLGLTTLTILDWAVRYVRRLGDESFNLDAIPLDDKPTYQQLQRGRRHRDLPAGVARHARPAEEDEARPLRGHHRAGRALSPGSDGPHPGIRGAQARHPLPVSRPSPRADPRPTYGIMVYQEQVMQIAQVLGGYSLGGADLLRRAMARRRSRRWRSNARSSGKARPIAGSRRTGRDLFDSNGEVRRLRLQQVALGRLRAHRLPDRLPQVAPPRRVHGGEPLRGDGRHRQGAGAARRCR
jgi:DNA polymerase-3 subunit alpha